MHELQLIMEDLRNQLAVIKGFLQLQKTEDQLFEQMLKNSINNADKLTVEALNIIQMFKYRDSV